MIDDLLLQEIYSLKNKLKIALKYIKDFEPDFDEQGFLHSSGHIDFDTWIEEISEEINMKDRMKEELENLRKDIYLYLLKNDKSRIDPLSWHFWKFYVWPLYKKMLVSLIGNTLNTEKCGAGWDHYGNIEVIEKATGKTWIEIKGALNDE